MCSDLNLGLGFFYGGTMFFSIANQIWECEIKCTR